MLERLFLKWIPKSAPLFALSESNVTSKYGSGWGEVDSFEAVMGRLYLCVYFEQNYLQGQGICHRLAYSPLSHQALDSLN